MEFPTDSRCHWLSKVESRMDLHLVRGQRFLLGFMMTSKFEPKMRFRQLFNLYH